MASEIVLSSANMDVNISCNSIQELDKIDLKHYSNTTIYNSSDNNGELHNSKLCNNELHNDMAIDLIKKTFPEIVNSDMSLQKMIDEVNKKTGYLVKEITEVKSSRNEFMFNAYAAAYELDGTYEIVFHGTSENNVKKICEEGFSLPKIKKKLYGAGIYTATTVWDSSCYAPPNKDNEQIIIIAKLLKGPTAVGKPEQTDYGVDASNNPILTLTDGSKKYNCSRHENQLLIIATMTIECQTIKNQDLSANDFKSQVNTVITYQPTIYNLMKDNINLVGTKAHAFASKQVASYNASKAQAEAQALAQARARVNAYNEANLKQYKANIDAANAITLSNYTPKKTTFLDTFYYTTGEKIGKKINKGDIVLITSTFCKYTEPLNYKGKVVLITRCNRTLIHILIDDDEIKKSVIKQNNKKKCGFPYGETQHESWLALLPDHVTVISSPTIKNENGSAAYVVEDKSPGSSKDDKPSSSKDDKNDNLRKRKR